ncbi:YaaR family protein [Wukongibacter sp. M2B1]|uniref:YaaR family protein n=1 Tax=Wukongibacter sp. M2B1 TaxID=3088895 RepID=UPI003D7A1FF4
MKISDISKHKSVNSLLVKESVKAPREVQSEFALKLNKLDGDALQEKLHTLLNDINAQSKEIEKKFDLSEVIKYKKLVKEFLTLTVNNSHKFSKENFLDRRGRHRVLSIVRQVDGELEGLTQDFLKKEKDKLKIINRLDGIRGMLLDIFM